MVCKFVGHHRSVSCARRIGGIWQSRCKRCGADIVRVRPTKWREMEKVASARAGRAH
jgi:phosphopantetheinyl transferase